MALAGERSGPVKSGVRDRHACSVHDQSRVQNDVEAQDYFLGRVSGSNPMTQAY